MLLRRLGRLPVLLLLPLDPHPMLVLLLLPLPPPSPLTSCPALRPWMLQWLSAAETQCAALGQRTVAVQGVQLLELAA